MATTAATRIEQARAIRGAVSSRSGASAEDRIAAHYAGSGHAIAHRRYRGAGGEIDLIARDGDEVIFVEVKMARDFASAAARLTRAQMRRICASAASFLAGEPMGQLTAVRFDVALVDGQGRYDILQNAFGAA